LNSVQSEVPGKAALHQKERHYTGGCYEKNMEPDFLPIFPIKKKIKNKGDDKSKY
jgi:hypothetical protein